MTTGITTESLPLTARPAWKALEAHYKNIRGLELRALFADDATRGERLNAEGAGIFLDYSKNRVTDETIALLCHLADASGLRDRIDAMFGGAKINVTEHRAVLHVALRARLPTCCLCWRLVTSSSTVANRPRR
jgi:glucose-6-phosphate isomerase